MLYSTFLMLRLVVVQHSDGGWLHACARAADNECCPGGEATGRAGQRQCGTAQASLQDAPSWICGGCGGEHTANVGCGDHQVLDQQLCGTISAASGQPDLLCANAAIRMLEEPSSLDRCQLPSVHCRVLCTCLTKSSARMSWLIEPQALQCAPSPARCCRAAAS